MTESKSPSAIWSRKMADAAWATLLYQGRPERGGPETFRQIVPTAASTSPSTPEMVQPLAQSLTHYDLLVVPAVSGFVRWIAPMACFT
jgi:hypothetical protein